MTAMHINYKEVCAVASAVARWAPLWAWRTVVVHTDSAVTKAILNKGRSKNAFINDVLRAVCWRSVTFDFELRAIHVFHGESRWIVAHWSNKSQESRETSVI